MARLKINFDQMAARFPDGTFQRIDLALTEGESRTDFLRDAVERELARREREAKRKASHQDPSP